MGLVGHLKHVLRKENRRRLIGPWIVANLGYDAVHMSVMVGIFARYGLNWWAYGAWVLTFSMIYAWSTMEFVGALVDGQPARVRIIGAIALFAFIAPELFIVTASHHVPRMVWIALGVYVSISAMLATLGLARKVRRRRRDRAEAQAPA